MADCGLIQMRRRIQRLLKYNAGVLQIPTVENVRQVLAEVVARRQFHASYSSWHERQRIIAADYCQLERARRERVSCINPVLAKFLVDQPVPGHAADIQSVNLSSNLPTIDPSDIDYALDVPPISHDNETQCPIPAMNGLISSFNHYRNIVVTITYE